MGLWAEMGVMEEDPPEVGHQAVDVHQLEVLEVEVDRQAEAGLEMVPEVQVSKSSVYWSVKTSVNLSVNKKSQVKVFG